MSLRRVILFLLALVFTSLRAQGNWRHDSQTATRENLWGVAFSGSAFVVVGEKGTILYSDYDGAAWASRVSGTDVWLVGVGHANGRWIAVGDQGTILVSDDNGDSWSPRASGTGVRLNNVVYGNGRWLAVGDTGGTVLTSTDNGETWATRTVPMAGFLRGLAFGQGRFLFGGSAGALFTTTDGATFSRVTFNLAANIEAVAITPGRFFVSGSDGLNATATALDSWSINGAVDNGTFRGLAARTDNDAAIAGDVAAMNYVSGRWFIPVLRPGFLVTAMTTGRDELVAVGFGGGIARSNSLYNVTVLASGGAATVVYGTDITLAAVPSAGVTNVSFQWQKEGADIPGATQAELTLRAVRNDASGSYSVRAANTGGSVSSQNITLAVAPAGRPTDLDSSFNYPFSNAPSAMAFPADGKTLVAGAYTGVPGSTQSTLVRLHSNGEIDPTFRPDPGAWLGRPRLLPDGRIYVTTSSSIEGSAPFTGVARLLASGALDASFQPDRADQFGLLHVAADGKIYVSSRSADGIVRLNVDGTRDNTFPVIPREYSFIGADAQGRIYARKALPGAFVWYYPAVGHRFLPSGARDTSYEIGLTNTDVTTIVPGSEAYSVTSSMGRVGASHSYSRALASGQADLAYVGPARTLYPDFTLDLSHIVQADGTLWDFRREAGVMTAVAFRPTGGRDPSRVLELPDNLTYVPLAVDAQGAIYAQRRASYYSGFSTTLSGPGFVRLRPLVGQPGRLSNLSVRAFVPSADTPLIAGFVTAGSGETRALVRAIGPGLTSFGVTDAMPDPQMRVVLNSATLAANDQWSATLAPRFSALGAFPLPAGSNDAALETAINAGDHSVVVTPAAGSSGGTALVEVYESAASAPRRFINLSSRGPVSPNRPLIVGFNITGDLPVNVLLRGVGPTLSQLGVGNVLVNPKITLYRTDAALFENDDWTRLNSTLSTSSTAGTGAFALASASADAAMLVKLGPGSYTVVVEAANGASGTALAEIYEVP